MKRSDDRMTASAAVSVRAKLRITERGDRTRGQTAQILTPRRRPPGAPR